MEWNCCKTDLLLSKEILLSEEIQSECGNILHIIKILLCTPFSNGKLKLMFSRMACVKNDYRNRLGRDLLDACLHVSEEGCNIASFNPNSAISAWYKKKERHLAAKPHNYP